VEETGMVLSGNRETIEACQRGDHDAFRSLFEAHRDRVYSLALRFSGDRAVAMDIAQEAFLKLLSAIRNFRGESSFDTWLYRLVVNCCLDHQRRRRRSIPLVRSVIEAVCAAGESAFDGLVRAERRRQVQDVVAKLPPEQRIVIVLRYTDGMSYDEIAEILSCSHGTVASRLNRAHKTLERRLSHLRGANSG
jgi:RNA polymerase sigma-70 factor (ECF subfamily)